jgi:hypothetical protein
VEVADLIHAGVVMAYRRGGATGISNILINEADMRLAISTHSPSGLNNTACSKRLFLAGRAIAHLVKMDELPMAEVYNPDRKRVNNRIPSDAVERFRDAYISLSEIKAITGRSLQKLRIELAASGIFPSFDLTKVGASIFDAEKVRLAGIASRS